MENGKHKGKKFLSYCFFFKGLSSKGLLKQNNAVFTQVLFTFPTICHLVVSVVKGIFTVVLELSVKSSSKIENFGEKYQNYQK